MNKDSLGDRMKGYEDLHRFKLMHRSPKVIRLDGKSFHTVLAKTKKPYDGAIAACMCRATEQVMSEIGGTARFAYTQSDECSIVINDALDLDTQAWFDNNIQKMASVAASVFTYRFNLEAKDLISKPAYFDARCFSLPDINELTNYLVWRQNDARRNSIQQYGRSFFSQKELHKLSCVEIIDKMQKEKAFDLLTQAPNWTQYGLVITQDGIEQKCPIFTSDRPFVSHRFLPKEVTQEASNNDAQLSDNLNG